MSTREKGTYQMLWDCPRCGTEKLLGLDHRHCPNCGSPQDPTRRYYPSDDERIAVEDHEFHGADKLCGACDAPNASKADFCGTCGCPLDDAEEAARRRTQAASGGGFSEDTADAADEEHKAARQAERERRQREMAGQPPEPEEPKKRGKGGLFAGMTGLLMLGFAVVCCGGLAFFFLWKKDAAFTVTGHAWERTVEVERFQEVEESDWKDKVPAGADIQNCKKAERDTKKVKDGETCVTKRKDQGDGTFKEVEECKPKYKEEPIFDEKCTYTVNKWKTVRTEKASGQGFSPAPSWPEVSLRKAGLGGKVGSEREGDRKERYTVDFKGADGKTYDCDFSNESKWKGFAQGASYSGQVGVMSGAIDCTSLKKQ